MLDLQTAKRRLARFVEQADSSPLYAHLTSKAAEDDDVAGLFAQVSDMDATPTLLFAVAHRLLAAEPMHPLHRYYGTLGGYDGPDERTWPEFKAFLMERADKASELLKTRFTQTNEVQRAAVVYPGVALAAKEAKAPVGLLEVGCSAGLLLGMDGFAYRYQLDGGEQVTAGPAKTPIGLHCAVEGAPMPKPAKRLKVAAKVGLDRSPVNAADEDELAWLEACVWADQPERARMLRTAAAAQAKKPPELITGDAVDDLRTAAGRIDAAVPLVVYTSHSVVYLTKDRRAAFFDELRALGSERPTWWVANEAYEALRTAVPGHDELAYEKTGMNVLCLTRFSDGNADSHILAKTHQHGRRLVWLR